MQTGAVTTGLRDYAVGSVVKFQLRVELSGIPDSLAGGSANFYLADPLGNVTGPFAATIQGDDAFFTYTVVGPAGTWARAWDFTDAAGVHLKSLPIPFGVVSSPA